MSAKKSSLAYIVLFDKKLFKVCRQTVVVKKYVDCKLIFTPPKEQYISISYIIAFKLHIIAKRNTKQIPMNI